MVWLFSKRGFTKRKSCREICTKSEDSPLFAPLRCIGTWMLSNLKKKNLLFLCQMYVGTLCQSLHKKIALSTHPQAPKFPLGERKGGGRRKKIQNRNLPRCSTHHGFPRKGWGPTLFSTDCAPGNNISIFLLQRAGKKKYWPPLRNTVFFNTSRGNQESYLPVWTTHACI